MSNKGFAVGELTTDKTECNITFSLDTNRLDRADYGDLKFLKKRIIRICSGTGQCVTK